MRLTPSLLCVCFVSFALVLVSACQRHTGHTGAAVELVRLESSSVPELRRLTGQVYVGGEPDAKGLKELADLGVRTVISVDGARPAVQEAAQLGLQYRHVPIVYGGITDSQLQQVCKVYQQSPRPVYIHCHHGLHRAPAMAAALLHALQELDGPGARQVMKEIGTSPHYQGLYDSAASAAWPNKKELAATTLPPAIAEVPDMAASMAFVARHKDRLVLLQHAGWQNVAELPDVTAAHEALLLREQYTELLRQPDTKAYGTDFVALLRDSEKRAKALEQALQDPAGTKAMRDKLWSAVRADCKSCHRRFR